MSADHHAKKEVSASEGGGVADYFAILGVGEKLVWKHAQKKSSVVEASPKASAQHHDEEDEAALIERFYREIVEVTILTTTEEEQQRPRVIGHAPSYTEEHDIRSVRSSSSLQQRGTSPALPNSPSHSDATTNVTFADPPTTAVHQQIEMDGFTVIQRTCPAGRSYSQTDAASLGGVLSNDSFLSNSTQPDLWTKNQTFAANLDPIYGLQAELSSRIPPAIDLDGRSTPLKGLQRKLGTSLRKLNTMVDDRLGKYAPEQDARTRKTKFQLGFRRRGADETEKPAVADVVLRNVKIHRKTICTNDEQEETLSMMTQSTLSQFNRTAAFKKGATIAQRILEKYGESRIKRLPLQDAASFETTRTGADAVIVPLEELITLPIGFDEWSVPQEYRLLKFANCTPQSSPEPVRDTQHKTILINHTLTKGSDRDGSETSSGMGVEAYMETGSIHTPPEAKRTTMEQWGDDSSSQTPQGINPDAYLPKLLPERLPDDLRNDEDVYVYVPILAVRRQRTGDEERYHEDPGVVDLSVTFCDSGGNAVLPSDDEDDEEKDGGSFSLTGKSKWTRSSFSQVIRTEKARPSPALPLGSPAIVAKRNLPIGFADAAFATQVLDRFPLKNYKDLPLPEEELPMFCYPTGCRLYRARYSDAPLPQYYGFVVKNERGDSIHVSCVSFMEPLTHMKMEQLNKISERRSRVSLAHRRYCEQRHLTLPKVGGPGSNVSDLPSYDGASQTKKNSDSNHGLDSPPPSETSWHDDDSFLTGFGDMTTFENKTICLISRYPFWTAFRRFLSHLHVLSGSLSDLPLERCISHLLLSVPVPRPGGPCVIVPLPALNGPMVLSMPPAKDFPLVDLPFQRLLACLDVPTVITVVLGFLALERKIIIMSSRPSLVLDACELLRSLLFPFELCAPYVPRLTQPFMSCLEFPGAIFVGIHDDGTPDGLASLVRSNLPEDSAIIDLDTGEIDCSGDRYEVLKQCWGVIPSGPRTVLVSEIETLCRDAGIVPGQEPLDSQVDSAFCASLPTGLVDDYGGTNHEVTREPLDDRAVRDAFLRFFCSVLVGYERHLVVPDADFLISGNEWFDAQGFLASAPQERAPYLGSLVSTQLFQSFIQRRTETGDVHCLLFDECLAEYHSSPVPYGRLGGDVETVANSDGAPQMLYSLLVDQCSTEAYHPSWDEDDRHGLDISAAHHTTSLSNTSSIQLSDSILQESGDIVTQPSRHNLTEGKRFVYCVDGNPCFPQHLDAALFYPSEPESLLSETSEMPSTLLARTEREVEEGNRRRKLATTYRGLHTQRRCLWQLPKLMGSHFLGAWLLCIPAQVSQPYLSYDQQARYLLRALGAFRLLRNKQRIVADEAAYRALIAACGRSGNDRRMELVKLFGLLRSDGIFPSAVTLGQYTRALAEGYSKRSFGMPDDHHSGVEVTVSASNDGRIEVSGKELIDAEALMNAFDGNLAVLEDSGRRWRQRHTHGRDLPGQRRLSAANDDKSVGTASSGTPRTGTADPSQRPERRSSQKSWLPVTISSSFVPSVQKAFNDNGGLGIETRVVAIWSRTRSCESCAYVPLDEEIQSGWDVVGGKSDVAHTVACPRCGSLFLPMLRYKELSLNEALEPPISDASHETAEGLPRQIVSHGFTDDDAESTGFVTYLDPVTLRTSLERYVQEEGEGSLDRDELRERDPGLFYNFWFYCARFSLPLPLPISKDGAMHYCAFVAWDKSIAFQGCSSGARALAPFYGLKVEQDSIKTASEELETLAKKETLGDFPLLSRFNLQEICQSDWDQKDLSEILVTLVEACDKRDFRPVLECVFRCNKRRLSTAREALNDMPVELGLTESTSLTDADSVEWDCYRTVLYLAKYQCTSVFHVFFPETAKPCKGYHFWCAIGTPLPVFDHLFREAAKRIRSKGNTVTPFHDVSDVALGFRCVFGHIL